MWLSSRRIVLAGLLAIVGGCGFTPAYAPGGSGDRLRGQLLVDAPNSREDFTFTARIEDRLGRNSNAALGLSYDLNIDSEELAITADQQIQRYNLVGTLDFAVKDRASGAVLTSGQVSNFTGYSATGTAVATLAAERDAYQRLTVILADALITRLVATGNSWLP